MSDCRLSGVVRLKLCGKTTDIYYCKIQYRHTVSTVKSIYKLARPINEIPIFVELINQF